ncbi:MAG: SDR family oxidoreductase [Rhodospirillaceae bacterium]|jgi:NAD(P)-dependent dehydrogenase (short-subunit alcohol dehydrogenase family)|nr:SDR family oxidoreductase [Rhodospirillaceae bacterium]MBT5243810.1 SDR family oxidoreductase [Rhodospirillaceae bacterium]MBT5563754.1 SDR family oxidoreductase [Rhodospirillaceae bacterium]MBT6242796.1 SDR family oxidoreductase [Rhodospirillaceae bacterium]MBT7137484.1 SDR family oxidoreductase [Rhodospirillaceae bacterium]
MSDNTKATGRLAGKMAVITGGAAGMGKTTALAFAQEGADVVILDIQKEAGEETAGLVREYGRRAEFIETDVSDAAQVDAAFDQIAKSVGAYDILFNHAGTITVKPLHESTEADYDRLMDINVRSAFLVCRRAVKEMSDNGGGAIVITGSIASELGYALESLYCMTKGAVLQLARTISVEYRDQGIRCNAVCPGFVKTAHGLREISELDAAGQEWEEGALAEAQGRICEPEEVAAAVVFLASDEASFITGNALYVDNGWYAKG